MISSLMSQIAPYLDAELIGGDAEINQVVTDSRRRCEHGLFIALKGPHFDAHNFLDQVKTQGAAGLVIEKPTDLDIPQLIVKNTRAALGMLAKYNRQKMRTEFAAITGSSGKTTVKEMLASIMQNVGSTYATQGNFNNEIGVPLTLLQMNDTFQYGIIELGANRQGEIAYTSSIVQPRVAVINNVAAAHLEGFGDLQGVARAKGEIYEALPSDGVAVLNNEDDFVDYWRKRITTKVISFSKNGQADVTAHDVSLDENHCPQFQLEYQQQSEFIKLPLSGEHNVHNALAAASCAIALGVALEKIAIGLAQTPIVSGRLMSEMLDNGCRLIDDTYNANLDSMRVAINLLKGYGGRRILIVGDMAELGEFGRQCHEEIGELATQAGIDEMYSCGVLTQFSHTVFEGKGQHFSNQDDLIKQLKQEVKADTTILIKGSRSAHMENVVLALTETSQRQNGKVAAHEGEN